MPELSLGEGIVQVIEEQARLESCNLVNTVWLEIAVVQRGETND